MPDSLNLWFPNLRRRGPHWFKSSLRNQKLFPFSKFRETRNHPNWQKD